MHALAALGCLALAALSGCEAFAQTNQFAGEPQPAGPTAVSVFALARQLVETAEVDSSRAPDEIKNEAVRLPLRNQLALSIRKAGLESAFGDYVATAISAWDFWDPQGETPARRLARLTQAIERLAKLMFVAGDAEGAGKLLARRYCVSSGVLFGSRYFVGSGSLYLVARCAATDELMLGWELDAGKLAAAARRLKETDWKDGNEVVLAERVARSFIAAGRAEEGYDMLASLRAKRRLNQVSIAEAYWRLGAVEEGRRLVREAAREALDDAGRDPRTILPVMLPGTQMAMGDRAGAIETLAQIRGFDAKRLDPLRPELAGQLAFAGLDTDAFALLSGMPVRREALSNIVIGQARRGDFDAAFVTVRKLQALPVERPEDRMQNFALSMAMTSILRNAARAGNTEAFEQASAMRRALNPVHVVMTKLAGEVTQFPRDADSRSLGDLARAGKARFAVDHALAQPNLATKVSGLANVAEALSGLPNPFDNPLAFYDPM